MTLLTIVQQHCRINSLYVPASVVDNSDATITQLLGLLNDHVLDMVDEYDFEALDRECTFTMVAATSQGTLASLAGATFKNMKNGTLWDRTQMKRIPGPLTAQEWQQLQAVMGTASPLFQYRIRGGALLLYPAPTVSSLNSAAFEFTSNSPVLAADGITYKQQFTVDTDTSVLPERLLKKALAYRWLQAKGMDYSAEERKYYDILNTIIAKDGTKRDVNIGGATEGFRPSIVVPLANWDVV